MRVSILRSFPHSRDGVTILEAKAGTEDEILDALVPGLEAAGFIDSLPVQKEPELPPSAVIPNNVAAPTTRARKGRK